MGVTFQEFKFLDAEGRLFVDLLPLVKRDYKFGKYNLLPYRVGIF